MDKSVRSTWLSRFVIFVKLLVAVGKAKIVLISVVSVIAILLVIFFVTGLFNRDNAGILINTTPTATVYIDDVEMGRTPYETTMKKGEITVRLVPDSFEEPLAPFETKVNLASGIQTIIDREFASTLDDSSGVIVSFEKVGGKEVSISIVSTPDAAQVMIDGQVKGFTPFKTSTITAGKHTIAVIAPGYDEKSLDVQTQEGYKLTAIFNLAKNGEELPEEVVEPDEVEEEVVEEDKVITVVILETPTGYLRVRKEPSTLAEEVGRVKPGEKYELLDEDEKTGWYKIQLDEGDEGWISNQYASKPDDDGTSSPKPSPTATPRATN